jgi:glycerophosphoryl diester phosphodiesterase
MRPTAPLLAAACAAVAVAAAAQAEGLLGQDPRPAYLVSQMEDGPLKERLAACIGQPIRRTDFSIGHRGAPLMFPEHTVESNIAAAQQGAGILECDVTFTKDRELVCRHAQNDLHTTTDILATPLAATCLTPFTPAAGDTGASAECRTAELTLAEFRTLRPKMDDRTATATTVEEYLASSNRWRSDLYAASATLMTHAESIELFRSLGAKFTPELKDPAVEMPFGGFTLEAYAQKLIDEYKAAGVPAADVWPQSFNLDVIKYWIEAEPEFGAQAVYLDDRYEAEDADEGLIDPMDAATFKPTMRELAEMGVRYLSPPLWMLVTVRDGKIVPSVYAEEAKAAGLNLITWTLERSGPLGSGGGWYFQSIKDVTTSDGVYYELLDVLAQDVGVKGVFSDWPVTVSFYASCMDLN